MSTQQKQVRPHRGWIIALVTAASIVVIAGMWAIPQFQNPIHLTEVKLGANRASNVVNEGHGDADVANSSAVAAMPAEEEFREQENLEREYRGLERLFVAPMTLAEDGAREARVKDVAKSGDTSRLDESLSVVAGVEMNPPAAGGRYDIADTEALGFGFGGTMPATSPTSC